MATVFLPCESEDWWEDKKLFLLLPNLRSVEELGQLIAAHTRAPAERTLSRLLAKLTGLHAFLKDYCSPEEQKAFCGKTLPFIAKSASCLDERVPVTGVPFLREQEAAALVLGRKLVLSLLANAFLCTFPEERSDIYGQQLKPFNFDSFFAVFCDTDEGLRKTQSAKLKCILCYFSRLAEEDSDIQGVITLRRQVIPKDELPEMAEWLDNQYPLCHFTVDNSKGIEDAGSHTLQVDFANQSVGGSVLGRGRVQEEIRFCICPELIISMLIMDRMDGNEAIVISGFERFSNYKGYESSLEFVGPCTDTADKDVFGNVLSSLVAIDALPFKKDPKLQDQFQETCILREINKAYIGFLCHQHRGDISTELLALKARRQSIALVGESYTDGGTSPGARLRPHEALGNINFSAPASQVASMPLISISTSSASDVSGPLSPIVEVSESPRVSVTMEGGSPFTGSSSHADSLFKGMGSAKPSAQAPEEDKTAGVDGFAAKLTSSLLEGVSGRKVPTRAPEKRPGEVDAFAAQLVESIFEGVTAQTQAPPKASEPSHPGTTASVDDFASSLARSILTIPSASRPPREDTGPSVSGAPTKAATTTKETVERNVEDLVKSVVSNILADLRSSSRPPQPPVQTVGQQSCEHIAVSSLATGLAESIISEALTSQNEHVSGLVRPTILVQGEKRSGFGVGESPGSSRSSSLTGQSITLHEFTDDLVESTIKEGAFIAHVIQSARQHASDVKADIDLLAEGLVSTSIQDVLAQAKPAQPESSDEVKGVPRTAVATHHGHHKRAVSPARTSKVGGLLRQGYLRKRLVPSSGDSSDPGSDQEFHINPMLLSTPSSRMSYSWSVASTRDEDSRPVSPTDMDKIALGFACNMEEFAVLFAEMLICEAIADTTGASDYSPHQRGGFSLEVNLPAETDSNTLTKGQLKITDFLSTLDQAESLSGGEDDTDSLVSYVPRWHKMQKALLRPVATGNWGCGRFGGDPQLKAMLQWMAVSGTGRPKIMYFPFKDKKLEKLEEVVAKLVAKGWTVGQLCQAVLNFAKEERREGRGVFDALLEL